MVFVELLRSLYDLFISLMSWSNLVLQFFITPIEKLKFNFIPDILVSPLFSFLKNSGLGEMSLLNIMLGSGIIVFLIISLVKWFLDIIL